MCYLACPLYEPYISPLTEYLRSAWHCSKCFTHVNMFVFTAVKILCEKSLSSPPRRETSHFSVFFVFTPHTQCCASDTSAHHMHAGFPHIVRASAAPSGGPTVSLGSNTVYLETASDPAGDLLRPTRLPPCPHFRRKPQGSPVLLTPWWGWRSPQRLFCHCSLAAQSHLTLCNPMDCSPPGSSVHGIFQARILEWVAISSSRGSS